ncbi:MAG: FHA domain-containing protein [Bdellovibrionaceae bacterium]|nr:FHA domain-containing protein [Pseudobdellovibrionaceae bacterium]
MSRLKVILRGTQISEIGLSPDREYIGGRKESCDIRLQPEKGISREHFRLKFEDGKWNVQSLSRFGEIFSLGQRVENITLEHNQAFQIPPYEFNYVELSDELGAAAPRGDAPEVSENEKTVIGVAPQMPYIKMLSSQGEVREMLRLEFGEIWVAGRDSSCQIIIPDQRVSRRQFEIRKINGIYTIIDMDSVNGTFLNGSVVSSTDPHPLKSGDAITVLDNTMYFELHDPNFQYRMDRIEIPPFQIAANGDELNYNNIPMVDEQIEAQQVQEEYVNENDINQFTPVDENQLSVSGGPFIGMPSPGQDPHVINQFYTFQPNENPEFKQSAFQKFKSNKPLLIGTVIVFMATMYFISEFVNKPSLEQTKVAQPKGNSSDPYSQLTTTQQQEIQELYGNAMAAMVQSRYDIAKESLEKLHKILPSGYQDSKEKLEEVILNEQTIIAQKAAEEDEKNRALGNEKIKHIIAECEKLITPDVTEDKMTNCLVEASGINPEHPDILRLKGEAKKIVDSKKTKEQEKNSYEALVKELDKIYAAAEELRHQGYPYKAIKGYNLVIESTLPDPKKLKAKATAKITFIEVTVKKRTDENLKNAEQFIKDGKLKFAIKALQDALIYDPNNRSLKERSDKYSNELRLQAMAIYQESIIDESFGYVDGNETRPGAKDKWKRIIELDSDDGEYYRKAYIKLKKYGVY